MASVSNALQIGRTAEKTKPIPVELALPVHIVYELLDFGHVFRDGCGERFVVSAIGRFRYEEYFDECAFTVP